VRLSLESLSDYIVGKCCYFRGKHFSWFIARNNYKYI